MNQALRKPAMLGLAGALAISLAACNGGGNSVPGFSNNNGYFRFVNASADAGPIDVYVDGQHVQGPGPNGSIPYGSISAFNSFKVGAHQIVINAAGTQTPITGIPTQALTQSVNGNSYESIALVGEVHPTQASDTLNLLLFTNNTFSTPSGGMAVNFHNAAPVTGTTPVQFGYYYVNTPSTSATMGQAIAAGSATQPQGVPSAALSASIQVGFYGGSPTQYTITPSQVDPTGCSANTLPCNTGSLTLYLIDGPAASTSPSSGPYPGGITATSQAGFVGIFDANGT